MKIYRENAGLRIRSMLRSDAETFARVLRSYGRESRAETYLEYFAEQEEGTRNVYVAEKQRDRRVLHFDSRPPERTVERGR